MQLHDKRILITGGFGLAGSAVYNNLVAKGCKDIFRYHSKEFDLTIAKDTEEMLRECKPNVVFHFAAAVGGIWANRTMPASFCRDNTLMNINILEACAINDYVQKLCLTGSGCVYPEHAALPLNESSLWDGLPEPNTSVYGVTKRMLTLQSKAYYQQYGLNSFVIFPTNLYGPGDNFHPDHSHVIAGIIHKVYTAHQNKSNSVILWGDGTPTRDFLYITDFSKMTIDLMERYESLEPVNVGTGKEVTIKRLTNLIKEYIGFQGKIFWDTSKPNGQQRRCFDCDRLEESLGYSAPTSLEKGLTKTIQWYNNNVTNLRLDSK